MLLNSFQADQQETFTTLQEFEDVLLNDPIGRIGDNFVDDILDSSWLKNVIKSLFPDSKEGSRQKGNRYIHLSFFELHLLITPSNIFNIDHKLMPYCIYISLLYQFLYFCYLSRHTPIVIVADMSFQSMSFHKIILSLVIILIVSIPLSLK